MNGALRRRHISTTAAPAAAEPEPVDAAWDEAFLRVESYLRAHQIESRMLLTRLTTEIVAEARALAAQLPDEAPVTLAMRLAHARIGEWFQRELGEGDWSDERFRARGRLALLMSQLPQESPELFLSSQPLPAERGRRLSQAQLQPAPGMRPTTMPPAMLEFPLVEIAEEKWVTFSRSAFARAAASWVLFISVLGIAWFATR